MAWQLRGLKIETKYIVVDVCSRFVYVTMLLFRRIVQSDNYVTKVNNGPNQTSVVVSSTASMPEIVEGVVGVVGNESSADLYVVCMGVASDGVV